SPSGSKTSGKRTPDALCKKICPAPRPHRRRLIHSYMENSMERRKVMQRKVRATVFRAGIAAIPLLALTGCPPAEKGQAASDIEEAALMTYVPPGEFDEHYLFYSGGHSGQVFVAGMPSMRHIVTVPVFAPYPGKGYGYDDDSRKMLGDFTWGDVHHPALSKTDGVYDGRWLFVNDNAHNRVARIDL